MADEKVEKIEKVSQIYLIDYLTFLSYLIEKGDADEKEQIFQEQLRKAQKRK